MPFPSPMHDTWGGAGESPWRRKWLLTPVFLPGEFHEQKRLVGYSPWGCKELDLKTPSLSSEPSSSARSALPTAGGTFPWLTCHIDSRTYHLPSIPCPYISLPWPCFTFLIIHIQVCVCFVAQPCLTLCDLKDCSPPGSSVHGTLQARTQCFRDPLGDLRNK